MTADRVVIFRASIEAIQELFQLPDGAYIDAVETPVAEPGVVRFRIRGIGSPVAAGGLIPPFTPCVRRSFDADGRELKPVINWAG